MGMPGTYNISDHLKGDWFDGVQFTLINATTSTPIDLTDATIRMMLKTDKLYKSVKLFETGDGITITDAVNGIFQVDPQTVDYAANSYIFDIEITFLTGVVKTYITGTWDIIQDITYGAS